MHLLHEFGCIDEDDRSIEQLFFFNKALLRASNFKEKSI